MGTFSNVGSVIDGTKFITFKVPLAGKDWDLPSLMAKVPNLRSVIDLTVNPTTNRYTLHSQEEYEMNGLQYTKIFIQGNLWANYPSVPSEETVQRFFDAVDAVYDDLEDELIGVQCTLGRNRSGYMICRYLIQRLGVDPEEAIERFNEARGHPQ